MWAVFIETFKYRVTQNRRFHLLKEGDMLNVFLCTYCLSGGVYKLPTCAALGNRGLVMAGWAAGAAGRLGIAPAAGAGAMWGIPGLGAI